MAAIIVWDDAKDAELLRMSVAGHTASEIAAAMGLKTRNPILGRLFRLRQRGIVRPDQVSQSQYPSRSTP